MSIVINLNGPQNVAFQSADPFQAILEPSLDFARVGDFFRLMRQFLREKRDPNTSFNTISVGKNSYINPTILHIVYIFWKHPEAKWNADTAKIFEDIIDEMLDDKRLNLDATFYEDCLFESEHFIDHATDLDREEDYSRNEGYSLERANIAHYAMAIGDVKMVKKVLEKAPYLIDKPCCLVKGKGLLSAEYISTSKSAAAFFDDESDFAFPYASHEEVQALHHLDDNIDGTIAHVVWIPDNEHMNHVKRTTKVTLLHIAARISHTFAVGFFLGRSASTMVMDSDGRIPAAYLRVSLDEGLFKESDIVTNLAELLKPVAKVSYLPETDVVIHKEGFSIVYDTRTKVPKCTYERLFPSVLEAQAKRDSLSFTVDKAVPKTNRTQSKDFTNSGYERGHMRPAANAVASAEAMKDTFSLANIAPQDPGLNKGYWKSLEIEIRKLAQTSKFIEVFTGALFVPQLYTDGKKRVSYEVIGDSDIGVPTHFFKVIYVDGAIDGVGYVFPNHAIAANTPFSTFQDTVEKVQKLSGILFNRWRT